MKTSTLILRNLTYYWRTNLAVVLGVATAVAVLAGALVVGDSVRASLGQIFLNRIGKTDHVISATGFFREQLAGDIQSKDEFKSRFSGAAPIIALNAFVTHEKSRRRASSVQLYGVDDRFWQFHSLQGVKAPGEREVLISPDLARELGSEPADSILLRVEKPSAIPAESLHGRKEELGRTIRLTIRETLEPAALGEFSIRPRQGGVRAVFVSLARLQKDLEQPGKANAILISENMPGASGGAAAVEDLLRETFALEDLGVRLRALDAERGISLESESALIGDKLFASAQAAAQKSDLSISPVLSYLANSIRSGEGNIPYSLVTGVSAGRFGALDNAGGNPIILNEWAASDLGVRPGDEVTLEYYLWKDDGRLVTETARFQFAAAVTIAGAASDRDLIPDYPGITETESLSDWDPPFPIDLERVRPKDEEYWEQYRTTPKAFIKIEAAGRLWQSRHGRLTSARILSSERADPASYLQLFKDNLRRELDPVSTGLVASAVRAEGLDAAEGATDFGEYFVYFSFFIVVAALLLASLFFKLGVEQRLREIGLLRAVGLRASLVRSIFLREGVLLAALGSLLGVAGALGYGALMVYGLRTWWVGAIGTTALELHVSPVSLLLGAAGGIVAAVIAVVLTLRRLKDATARGLLAGVIEPQATGDNSSFDHPAARTDSGKRARRASMLIALIAVLLLAAAWSGLISQVAGFFGAGAMLLVALLAYQYAWLKRQQKRLIHGSGAWPLSLMGFRNASHRPGRSILCIALIASAAFIIVAVDAFRREGRETDLDKRSGTGGYPLVAESLLPLYHNPNTEEGREALTLSAQKDFDPAEVAFTRFRVRPGDDASCLNLYQPRRPRVLGAPAEFIQSGRFKFQASESRTAEQEANPWLLLDAARDDEAIPVIADANSMTYVLHRKLGDEIVIEGDDGEMLRLRLVAALSDSILQSELVMSEANFIRLFPGRGGYSFFLLDVDAARAGQVVGVLEEQLSDFGFDAASTAERLASFHRVENTYLSVFQTLGALGLALGTLGLATVLLRNVLERRKELALLRAVGYNSRHFALMVIAENAFLVFCGLATGVLSAALAIAPAFITRGGQPATLSLAVMLLLVIITGLLASILATLAALRAPLIPALRAE
jgi:ABC-type lipoprotein release transport system permease subunit